MTTCKLCGINIEEDDYCRTFACNEDIDHYCKTSLCQTCTFWQRIIKYKGVRINGHHYLIEPEPEDANYKWKGFSGKRFHIKYFNGKEVITTNLWYQGKIPKTFRGVVALSDNAEFVNKPVNTTYYKLSL